MINKEILIGLPKVKESLKSFTDNALNLIEEASPLLSGRFEDEVNKIKGSVKGIQSRISQLDKPRIMLYGVYNAGKSTLLNALAGKKLAETGDIPTTTEVNSYVWQDYKFYDTPGIDSPEKKEEEKAKALISEVEVVIFVLRDSGTIEEEKIYEEMKYILNQGKELFIVLNLTQLNPQDNKDREVISAIKRKIFVNLRKAMKISEDIELPCHFFQVNAMMAFNGKTQGKEKLIEISGIRGLEAFILRNLKKEQVFKKCYETVFQNLLNALTELENIVNEINPEKEKEKLWKVISDIKGEVKEEIFRFIELNIDTAWRSPLTGKLRSMIWENIDKEREVYSSEDISKEAVKAEEEFFSLCFKKLKVEFLKTKALPELERELTDVIRMLEEKEARELGEKLRKRFEEIKEGFSYLERINFASKTFSEEDITDKALRVGKTLLESEAFYRVLEQLKEKNKEVVDKKMKKVFGEIAKKTGALATKKIAEKALEKTGEEIVKTALKRTIGKIAIPKIPFPIDPIDIFIIIDLIKSITDAFREDVDAKIKALEEKERIKQEIKEVALQDITTLIEKLKLDVELSTKEQFAELVDNIFEEWFESIESEEKFSKAQEVLSKIQNLKNEVQTYFYSLQ